MRLTPDEHKAIVESVKRADAKAEVYLYGSRTNDSLKGGDIDLVVISETLKLPDKVDLLIAIKDKIGEQKIDLSIKTKEKSASDPFTAEILKTAIKL